jgi:hypothetical protein
LVQLEIKIARLKQKVRREKQRFGGFAGAGEIAVFPRPL